MSEKSILYTDENIKARDEGRKTHTRRVIVPHNLKPNKGVNPKIDLVDFYCIEKEGKYYAYNNKYNVCLGELIPKYQVGDIMLIKEDYKYWLRNNTVYVEYKDCYPCGVGGEIRTYNLDKVKDYETILKLQNGKQNIWKCKRFMFNFMIRKKDTVTKVRAERLQDISEEDIIKEGIVNCKDLNKMESNRFRFYVLWDSINAERGYPLRDNPWVFVYEFERLL
jgi:hypothetical protein